MSSTDHTTQYLATIERQSDAIARLCEALVMVVGSTQLPPEALATAAQLHAAASTHSTAPEPDDDVTTDMVLNPADLG